MFIIFQTNLNKYFRYREKVIAFNDEREAYNFANLFYNNFAIPQAMGMMFEDPGIIHLIAESANNWRVDELPQTYDFSIINFDELRRG